mgnify:FL=1
MVPEKFSRESEQFQFFSKLSDFGKYSASCEYKNMYLEIGKLILEELKTTDFEELMVPLNNFYRIMSKYWNAGDDPSDWQSMIDESDNYVKTLPKERQEFMSKVLVAMMDGINDKYKIECGRNSKLR